VAKKELEKRISNKKRQQITGILEGDVEYQEALRLQRIAEQKNSAKLNQEYRTEKIQQAEAGNVDKTNLHYAPLHTLPPAVKTKIQEHAKTLLAGQKPGSKTYKALERIVKDAGSDNTAAAIEQKERIIGQMSGQRGVENVSGKWRKAEPDTLLDLYTSPNGPAMAEEAIASIDRGQPDATAKRLIQEVTYVEDPAKTILGESQVNPDADDPPELVVRNWLEQVAGRKVPKAETPTPGGWVTQEGKLRPEVNQDAQAAAEVEEKTKGQGYFDTPEWTEKVKKAHENIRNWAKGGTLHTGLPMNIVKDCGIVVADWMGRGVRSFPEMVRRLTKEYGLKYSEKIKKQLRMIWKLANGHWHQSRRILERSRGLPPIGERQAAYRNSRIIELREEQSFDYPEGKLEEIIDRLIRWARPRGILGDHINQWDKQAIRVEEGKIRNALSHGAGRQKIKLLGILPQMLREGVPIDVRANYDNPFLDDQTYLAKAKLDGEEYAVALMVHEDSNGKKFYDHEMTELKKLGSDTPRALPRSNTGGGRHQNQASLISIANDFVKSKSESFEENLSRWQQRVRDAETRLREFFQGRRMNTGIPLDLMHDCIVVGAEIFRRGITSLPKWAKTMIDTFGNRFKPEELKRIYQASKVYYRDVVSDQKIKKWNRKQKEIDTNQQMLFEED